MLNILQGPNIIIITLPRLQVCCDWSMFLTTHFSRRSLGRIGCRANESALETIV